MSETFDAQRITEALQEAVRVRDGASLETLVSESMIWVMPSEDNQRGKDEWIEASCSITWHWFEVEVRRTLDLQDVRVVEVWINQSRGPVPGEDDSRPVTAAGIVLDVWAEEQSTWRLVARHPQRATD